MEEQKMYKIDEILAIAINWLNDPEGEDEIKALSDLKSGLIVKDYMPIGQKELLLKKIMADIMVDEKVSSYTATILYEIAIVFDGLLAYVVNLDPDINTFYKDASFYDVFKLSGITDYILSFCEKDYQSLRVMADRMLSFENLDELIKNMQLASPEQVEMLTEEFKKFRTETSPEMLKSLGDIAAFDDPLLTNIKSSIENGAFQLSQEVGDDEDEDSEEK